MEMILEPHKERLAMLLAARDTNKPEDIAIKNVGGAHYIELEISSDGVGGWVFSESLREAETGLDNHVNPVRPFHYWLSDDGKWEAWVGGSDQKWQPATWD